MVVYIGNRTDIDPVMMPLIARMIDPDPTKRPKMDEMNEAFKSLGSH
jgi:hypothetical protein